MRARDGRAWAAAAGVAAAWAAAVPFLGEAVGARLDVPARLEVADHVVPGAVMLVAALVLAAGSPATPGGPRWSTAAALTFLAGAWILATHVPLVPEALSGVSPWPASLLHVSAALPALTVGVVLLLRPLRGGAPG